MNNPSLNDPWTARSGRVVLLLCVWPLITTAGSLTHERPFFGSVSSILPSNDGRLLWLKTVSASHREIYAVFNWDTARLQTCERRETGFGEPDAQAATRGLLNATRSLATMDRDAKNGWSLVSDGQRTYVVDEVTGNELYTIARPYVVGRFVPATQELVYVGPNKAWYRVRLPSGKIAAMHQPWNAYWPMAVAWGIALGCWLGGWLLLLAVYGAMGWIDIAGLSISAMLLSAAFHEPHFDVTHAQLTVGLFASLAIIVGLGVGSLAASWPMIVATAIAAGTTFAFCVSFVVAPLLDRTVAAFLGVALLVIANGMCLTTLWRAARGWHLAPIEATMKARPARPSPSLSHFFVLTASCAYLLIVLQMLSTPLSSLNERTVIPATVLPAVGLLVGNVAISVGLDVRLPKWKLLLIPASLGLGFAALLQGRSGLSPVEILWPPFPVPLGPGIGIWTGLFTALWICVLRGSGLRMRNYTHIEVA